MASQREGSDFYREYDLSDARINAAGRSPAPHQSQALAALDRWYRAASSEPRGGILVLPTGGGKTFTASRFICSHPLSSGYKVLWLAHTHHLLEQAFYSFEGVVGQVTEPKSKLNCRVVSGTDGHFPAHTVRPDDDVVVGSLQTVCSAVKNGLAQFERFIAAADGHLFVVFDEAHHSPAPSYRRLLQTLRERCADLRLLGLTATPTYGEEKGRGWLRELFPQGIVHQVEPRTLIASGVLARPVFEQAETHFEATFDEEKYQEWAGSNRDLPEEIVTSLASSRERNEHIAGWYVNHRSRYGKTIIFADRWAQCEQISQALQRRGVKAGAIYSHVVRFPKIRGHEVSGVDSDQGVRRCLGSVRRTRPSSSSRP